MLRARVDHHLHRGRISEPTFDQNHPTVHSAVTGDAYSGVMDMMKKRYSLEVGLSDHTMGVGASIAAIAHGATVIEKHFTLKRSDGGVDSTFSLEPEEMKNLVIETERAWLSLGNINYGTSESEKSSLKFRRSLYFTKDIKAGELITNQNLKIIRPGLGLPPKYYEILLGKQLKRNVKIGTAATWDLIK